MKRKIIYPVLIVLWSMGLILTTFAMSFFSPEEVAYGFQSSFFYKAILLIIIASIAIYMILSKLISEITGPIEELKEEAKSIAKGEYTHHLHYYSMEEIETLANEFEEMGENLYRTIRKLKYQKTKAESVLATLDEGIFVLEKDGVIKEANAFMIKLLGIDKVYKCQVQEVLRYPKALHAIKEAMGTETKQQCEILTQDKVLYMNILPMKQEAEVVGYIISMRDMTKTRRLEELRYQFVNNVTHELKTPLTSIQGFVETLKSGALENPKVAMRFLDIIDLEAQRLYRLIQDILLLSEIESMQIRESETVSLVEEARQVIALLNQEADKKQIKMILEAKEDVQLEKVSRDHIRQLFINLIGNGIKYTDQGFVKIKVFKQQGEKVIIVEDTGIGIPEESTQRIFERFYTVDKSRSRKSGGTGLGLAIVKHIIHLYRGSVSVHSKVGEGSQFVVRFE
jgi:two-component system phosphate regulon sensor histidine kinase PhoR